MARYTGPKLRRVRALGTMLPGLTRKDAERRPYPPGQHGQARKGKLSEYAVRLREKQKLLFNYGLSEKQLRAAVKEARRGRGDTGQMLLAILERRLDNAVFRAGFAQTIPHARQLVNHGHILIDGKRVDIAAFQVKAGNKLSLHTKAATNVQVLQSLQTPALERPAWVTYDEAKATATIATLPDADSVPVEVHVPLVIEYYSQRL